MKVNTFFKKKPKNSTHLSFIYPPVGFFPLFLFSLFNFSFLPVVFPEGFYYSFLHLPYLLIENSTNYTFLIKKNFKSEVFFSEFNLFQN